MLRQERIIRYALVERLARALADMARRDGIKETLQAVSAILHNMLARFNSDGPDEDEDDDENKARWRAARNTFIIASLSTRGA